MIIGIVSSIIGILVIVFLVNPINMIIGVLFEDNNLFRIYIDLGILCVIFNIIVVVLSGYIPVKIASKKKLINCICGY